MKERAAYVSYSWTEDGLPETCTASQRLGEAGDRCYHCGQPISGPCIKLEAADGDVYLLHADCARRGCRGRDFEVLDSL